ncbi:DEAD/DEAH box helicase family protein [Thalassobacterium sedimentorum]|nr:DEAD/DEAH box helicase family protein [Coraliomargarita sp. SDUM461004]
MQSHNFEFLRKDHPELADLAGFAESYSFADPVGALVKLRMYAEFLVKAIFAHHKLELTFQSNLNDLLHDASFCSITPAVVKDKLHLLRIKGNQAAHGSLSKEDEARVPEYVKEAFDLGRWHILSTKGAPAIESAQWTPLTPEIADPAATLKQQNKAQQKKLAEQEALMAKLLSDLEMVRTKAEATGKSETEKLELLKHAQQAASTLEFSEEETRFKLIDELLRSVGWDVGARGKNTAEVEQEREVTHQPTTSGIGYIDYVLKDPNSGKVLAVVEAKKTAEDADKGKVQAKYYADGIEKETGHRPIIFYTNGYEIYIWNDGKGEPPRSLFGFYSQDSLEYELYQIANREQVLGSLNPKEQIVDRLYQIEAIKRVTESFDARRRKALLIQATGTGKTRVAIALSEVMIRASWAKRILFLCDRRELRKQANDAFEEHMPDEPRVYVNRKTGNDRNKRIYLATYPAMMKCFQNFDVGFFDLIIADESHRSIYNRYRDLFRYFDAYQVGLTATPLKFIFRNTYKLFECENEDPTANYTYEDAIEHNPPYLCPFKVVKHTTKFLRDGIKYKALNKVQQEQLDEQVEDSETVNYEKEQVSRQVFNRDTDRAIIRNLMENGLRGPDGTRVGKTIIFARNHKHAKQLVDVFDECYPQYGGDFCLRIDNYEPRAEQLIDDFKNTDGSKNLTIAVSVDMLDTGIDVPSLLNLVFAKPVKSYAKFWQMIGRGTRLCKDLFGPGKDKSEFLIFDHWGNFEYFDELVKEEEPSQSKSLPQQLFEARIALGETALKQQDLDGLKTATALIAADIAALPADSLSVREKVKTVKAMQASGVIEAFEPHTVATLKRELAPLMQWRDIRSKEAALQFDLLIAKLEVARLEKSAAADDLTDTVVEQVSQLPINLKQVEEKLPAIQKAKDLGYHNSASVKDLEYLRTELRGIMKHRKKDTVNPVAPLFLDVAEDQAGYNSQEHKVKLSGLDLAAYRSRVESVLKELFDANEALRKIKAGQAILPDELNELVHDVLMHDPYLHLEDLLVHYPNKSKSLALAIRQVIGMDAAAVDAHFKDFVQKYPALNANQIRFLEMLKSHISRYGVIELDQLWESPFTSIDSQGVEGVFKEDDQVNALLELLKTLNNTAA